MTDSRFPEPGVDARFPEPGVDRRFPEPGVDAEFLQVGRHERFAQAAYGVFALLAETGGALVRETSGFVTLEA